MPIDPGAFEHYRQPSGSRPGLPRLFWGAILIGLAWFGATLLIVPLGVAGRAAWAGTQPVDAADAMEWLLASPLGLLLTLATFAGIWVGVALAMRLLHATPMAALYGGNRRIAGADLVKGLLAALAVGLLGELAFYLRHPVIERGPIESALWFAFLAPALLLIAVQTSAEELLFRGYFLRGLAQRFRSPLVWALLPGLVFTLLHWRAGGEAAANLALLAAIGGFAALTTVLVYLTGNLGAAIGVHWGNNAMAFLLVAHEDALNGLALFHGASIDDLVWTPGETLWFILAGAVVGNGLTLLLLVHPSSPLSLGPEVERVPPSPEA